MTGRKDETTGYRKLKKVGNQVNLKWKMDVSGMEDNGVGGVDVGS